MAANTNAQAALACGPQADVDHDEAARSRCELLLTLAVRAARRIGAAPREHEDPALWCAWRIALPTPGFVIAAREVTAIVSVLEATGFGATYGMSARDLVAVVLQPVAFPPWAVEVSVELARVASATRVLPSAVVATRLIESLILDGLASLMEQGC
jgi:hypothetical protein